MTYVLGLNSFHGDAAACLLNDGKIVAAAEEERFRRVKHWAGFPAQAVRYCLQEAGIGLDAVDHVALNQDSRAHLWRKVCYTLSRRPHFRMVFDRIRAKRKRADISALLRDCSGGEVFRGKVHHVEHHLAHLASAFLVSPFDEAVVVSVDGFGDFASAAWGVGSASTICVDERVHFPHSLGIFYEALTQYLGFPHYGDEYKVMGLASYGRPAYLDEMRRIVELRDDGTFRLNLEFFRHDRENISYQWDDGSPEVGVLFSQALVDLLGASPPEGAPVTEKHKDIAASVQAMYEEAFFHLLNHAYRRYRLDTLALAGGCAMNSVANGKIYGHTPFRKLYVQSAGGDAGGALGAALIADQTAAGSARSRSRRDFVMKHAYWGPQFTEDEVRVVLDDRRNELLAAGCTVQAVTGEEALCAMTAQAIADAKVIGWFQGRMEWGPRALGNRSIVCDPRREDMKDILNLKIKRRESFRPFAPSILREAVAEWFEVDDDVPFMTQVYPIRAEKRRIIPAVTHVDGSGRLQTVEKGANPRYYRLIEAFRAITGVPLVLNTSFNENEPVVCLPEEALDCFLRTRMDVLVLNNFMICRTG